MNPSATASRPRQKTGSFSGDIIPKGYQKKPAQLQQYTDEQLKLLEHSMGQVGEGSYLSRLAGGDEDLFNEMEAPAFRQFNAGLGGLASRFSAGSGQGSLGTRRSSGFQNEGTSAMSNFAQDLQSKRQGLQRQAIQDLMGFSSQLLDKRPYDRAMVEKPEKQSSGWGGLAGAGLGAAGGFFASGGNPYMALKGAQLGHTVGSQF